MNAQTQLFCTMLLAMCDDELWRVSVDNQIGAQPEVIDWFEDEHQEETVEYVSYQDDISWLRTGGA